MYIQMSTYALLLCALTRDAYTVSDDKRNLVKANSKPDMIPLTLAAVNSL